MSKNKCTNKYDGCGNDAALVLVYGSYCTQCFNENYIHYIDQEYVSCEVNNYSLFWKGRVGKKLGKRKTKKKLKKFIVKHSVEGVKA